MHPDPVTAATPHRRFLAASSLDQIQPGYTSVFIRPVKGA